MPTVISTVSVISTVNVIITVNITSTANVTSTVNVIKTASVISTVIVISTNRKCNSGDGCQPFASFGVVDFHTVKKLKLSLPIVHDLHSCERIYWKVKVTSHETTFPATSVDQSSTSFATWFDPLVTPV